MMRRMMIAASMMAARKSPGDVASALDYHRRAGWRRAQSKGRGASGGSGWNGLIRRACAMDAGFKDGTIKDREQALAGLILSLMTAPD